MGGMFKPQRNKGIEQAQKQQASLLAKEKNREEASAAARRRSIAAAQSGRQRGLLSALQGSGITRKLGGG